ncbi:carbamoyl-phosphate synthase L chain, ATP binding domain-containing protein [Dichotomocladium elegans]|nr:carbamoyl-phosphate synthase L chain, ATP binding domain-containing protein [Dichotomocladium elegans]
MKLLVANRGEIAIRALVAAAELGLQTVAVYSDDQDKSHCEFAHQSIKLKSLASFLDPHQIIAAAQSVQANAIHPGYGFLSESSELADLCQKKDILFVGPSSSCIAAVGDKVSAREVAKAAKVPVIPGTDASVRDAATVIHFANQFGYPVMLKARDGGGGRGIRLVHSESEVAEALKRCINESPSKQVFVEKAIIGAKHIEVQILGDRHGNIIHLLERDCSAQRRYQKIVEVAPAPSLPLAMRQAIHDAALRLASSIRYDSAGTVEFLVLPDAYYFLEVNPRIQVEHTISEQITNVDLVQSQIRIAMGEALPAMGLMQSLIPLTPRVVAIQARIVSEDPNKDNMLSVGRINQAKFPTGHGIRIDTWIKSGCVVLPMFDSLLGKIIVTGQSFEDAVRKMTCALERTNIDGVATNIDFMLALVNSKLFVENNMAGVHVKFLDQHQRELLQASSEYTKARYQKQQQNHGDPEEATLKPIFADVPANCFTFRPGDAFNIELDTKDAHALQIESIATNNFPEEFSGKIQTTFSPNPIGITVMRKAAVVSTMRRKASAKCQGEIPTPITGMLVELNVRKGDSVQAGQQVFVMSAMKMETVVRTKAAGHVKAIYAKENDLIEAGDLVVEISEQHESKL